ncbi:MAG: glycoside hydrolase family 3 C-terminal domain-containing protein [Blautia sp.]|nr:glycoside hydrolase family 3 C-terminal domain-containing protein [Blautia sp.]
MEGKKKMSNKKFAGIWGTILAILLIVVLVGNFFADKYQTIITRALGHKTSMVVEKEGSEQADNVYFKSDYASKEELIAHEVELSHELEGEGIVLMKNEDNTLPMAEGLKISMFGIGSAKFVYSGSGSGAVDTSSVISLKEAFEQEGYEVNPALYSLYNDTEEYKVAKEMPNSEYTKEVYDSLKEYNDMAIVVISRNGQEAMDVTPDRMLLSKEEMGMLGLANAKFENVVVLLNMPNTIELGWLDEYEHVKACAWVGFPGQEGIISIPRVLKGTINPSGRTVDTFPYSSMSAPAAQIYGFGRMNNGTNETGAKATYTVYGENIYVGYRYYETRYEDTVLKQGNADASIGSVDGNAWDYTTEVQFPFGYGLSYTEFTYRDFAFTENEDSFTVDVNVTNDGDVEGKEVVELYFQSPYTDYDKENLVEKASVELCGFAKTGLIAPGESEAVSIEIPKETLRAFDSNGAKTYIVDEGTYYFSVGRNAHDALNNIMAAKGYTTADGMDEDGKTEFVGTFEQKELDTTTYAVDAVTGTEITNRFDNGSMIYYDDTYVYLTRNDWEGTWPTFYGEADAKGNYTATMSDALIHDSQDNLYEDDPEAVMPVTDSGENINLITMRGKDYDDPDWEAVLDCLTVEEMMEMVRLGGWQTAEIPSISKPKSNDQDGPAGISDTLIHSDLKCMGYPIQEVLASTWNVELSEEMGRCIGEDGLSANVQGWYAPGAGMHRSPIGGRNYEYYSEDGYLSGAMCAKEVAGAQSKGMYCYLKHLVLNDQEDHRYGIATFATEQAIRELYMTPFEMAVKEADCHGMMAAFASIGGIWCGANKALIQDVLEKEWGFHGIVVTDYASACAGFMWTDMGLSAGCDLWLNTDSALFGIEGVEKNPTLVTALRNASHDILYTVVNSSAMNGISENVEIRTIMPLWKKWLVAFDIVMAVIIIGGALLVTRRCKKNK